MHTEYPRLGAIERHDVQRGELSDLELIMNHEHGDEGQKQPKQIRKKCKCPCSSSMIAFAIVFTIFSIVGGGVVYHFYIRKLSASPRNRVIDPSVVPRPVDVRRPEASEEVMSIFMQFEVSSTELIVICTLFLQHSSEENNSADNDQIDWNARNAPINQDRNNDQMNSVQDSVVRRRPRSVGHLTPTRWTVDNLDALKPIFLVECRPQGVGETFSIFLQWICLSTDGSKAVFRVVMSAESNPDDFYVYVPHSTQMGEFPGLASLQKIYDRDGILLHSSPEGLNIIVAKSAIFYDDELRPDRTFQSEKRLGLDMRFKRVVRQDRILIDKKYPRLRTVTGALQQLHALGRSADDGIIRWTILKLNAMKPIFLVDISGRGEHQPEPMYLQWRNPNHAAAMDRCSIGMFEVMGNSNSAVKPVMMDIFLDRHAIQDGSEFILGLSHQARFQNSGSEVWNVKVRFKKVMQHNGNVVRDLITTPRCCRFRC